MHVGTPIDALGIPKRIVERLRSDGIESVEVLATLSPGELCFILDSRDIALCEALVAKARSFLGLKSPGEMIREFYERQKTSFVEMLKDFLSRPLFILAPSELVDGFTGEAVDYCVKLYTYSLETKVFEIVIMKCYESSEKAGKDFDEAAKMLKQRLGNLVCVHSVDGDCFKYFEF